jgi:hypothetical protein
VSPDTRLDAAEPSVERTNREGAMSKVVELLRHTDNDGDILTEAGVAGGAEGRRATLRRLQHNDLLRRSARHANDRVLTCGLRNQGLWRRCGRRSLRKQGRGSVAIRVQGFRARPTWKGSERQIRSWSSRSPGCAGRLSSTWSTGFQTEAVLLWSGIRRRRRSPLSA